MIIQHQELPLAAMALTYGLLQLPKMPELKNRDISDFREVENFDFNSVAYKDAKKEKVRLEKLEEYKNSGKENAQVVNVVLFIAEFTFRSLARFQKNPPKAYSTLGEIKTG